MIYILLLLMREKRYFGMISGPYTSITLIDAKEIIRFIRENRLEILKYTLIT